MKYFLSIITLACLGSACKDSNDQPIPTLSIEAISVVEQNTLHTESIEVKLSSGFNGDLSFNFRTEEISAKSGDDFVMQSGTVTVPAGNLSAMIDLEIVGDDNLELTESMAIILEQEGTETEYIVTIQDDDSYAPERVEDGYITPVDYPSMELVWNDEFEGPEVDAANWSFNIGNGCDEGICGWGNEELQDFTDDPANVYFEDGKLVIKALSEPSYTSARLLSDGKQEFQYGRIDFRAKMPEGQGLWPALWMLGTNIEDVGWPQCGEIDIMEMIGKHPSTVYGTAHYDANGYASKSSSSKVTFPESLQNEFHVYSIIWERNTIRWYFDYKLYNTLTQSAVGATYPFNQPFYFIMNVAIGGLWPGNPDETTVFPQEMVVDYVRVFR